MSDQFLSLIRRTCRFDTQRFKKDIQRFTSNSSGNSIINNTKQLDVQQIQQHNTPQHDNDDQEEQEEEDTETLTNKRRRITSEKYGIQLFSDTMNNDDRDDHENENENDNDDEKPGRTDDDDTVSARVTLARQLKQFRKQHSIHVSGSDVPQPTQSFNSVIINNTDTHSYIIDNLHRQAPEGLGFTQPTPIQMQAIPIILADRECVGCAPTGSGKSVAFLLPLLLSLFQPDKQGIRAVIIAPTKELAIQLHRVACKLSQGRKWRIILLSKANVSINSFSGEAGNKKDIVIATPLRLLQLLQTVEVNVSHLRHVVLDEADRLLDMGFLPQVDQILALLKQRARTTATASRPFRLHLFSATLPHSLDTLIPVLLFSPIVCVIAHRNTAQSSVKQSLVYVGNEVGKLMAMRNMIREGLILPMLIFVQSAERGVQLSQQLLMEKEKLPVDVMAGDQSDAHRMSVVNAFRTGSICMLITTDVLSRGIDFPGVESVLNYDFPQSATSYIHRIGRAGRAGRTGTSITFYTQTDTPLLRNIASVMKYSGANIPDWMLNMKKIGKNRAQRLQRMAPPREPILTPAAVKEIYTQLRLIHIIICHSFMSGVSAVVACLVCTEEEACAAAEKASPHSTRSATFVINRCTTCRIRDSAAAYQSVICCCC